MRSWLIELSGDRTDLEEFPRWFPDGNMFAIEENGRFFLTGPDFDRMPSAEAVLNEASVALDRFWAVISLLWPSLRKPTISNVIQETDEGSRNTLILLSASMTLRTKATGTLTVGAAPARPDPTQAQGLLNIAKQSPNLNAALLAWAHPYRTWPQLYRIIEEIQGHLGASASKAGLCSANELTRLNHSANTAEVAGADARHATGTWQPPADPMSLEEATSFVADVLLKALQKAAEPRHSV